MFISCNTFAEISIDKALSMADVNHPYFKKDFYGKPTANLYKANYNRYWLIHQARYGGDGDHTENIIMIFDVTDTSVNKIFQYSISNVSFELEDGLLTKIKGDYILSLCSVCDGWEVSEPSDIFKVPLEISIPTLIIKPTFTKTEASDFLNRFNKKTEPVVHDVERKIIYGLLQTYNKARH